MRWGRQAERITCKRCHDAMENLIPGNMSTNPPVDEVKLQEFPGEGTAVRRKWRTTWCGLALARRADTLAVALLLAGAGGVPAERPALPREVDDHQRWAADFHTGVLWQFGGNTSIDYVLLPQIVSLRTPAHLRFGIGGGEIVVRARFSLLAEAFAHGPETGYLGFSCAPSVEYWPASRKTAIFVLAGGGAGWVDSQDVEGGQGQDFTLNWFAETGVRWRLRPTLSISASAFFQHMSNGGATDPNPGIDAAGPMLGLTWEF